MSRFCPLFSGSSGNCAYIGCSGGGVLIDAGVSAKGITAALDQLELSPASIQAVFVTHEHGDHVKGLKVFAGKNHIPIYASQTTLEALERDERYDGRTKAYPINGAAVELDHMRVSRFATSHDCPGSSGYVVETGDGRKLAVCTDLGYVSEEVRDALTGCDLILLESNHDVMMLQNGPYPYYLKRRILSDCGHLSNAGCAAELGGLIRAGATRLVLGHISKENNYPELALASARAALVDEGYKEDMDYILRAALPAGGRVMVL
ncbi:MAG: MBL fold metallo-hydrolase [Clostridiales bacterium]|nr:MBL fold metallo-hydrolase [Clostridiales bacterium]